MVLRYVLILICSMSPGMVAVAPAQTLRNDNYTVTPAADGAVIIAARDGGERVFRPIFVVLTARTDPGLAARIGGIRNVTWQVPTWKAATAERLGKVNTEVTVGDGFDPDIVAAKGEPRTVNAWTAAEVFTVTPTSTRADHGGLTWLNSNEAWDLSATLDLPAGHAEPRLRFTFTPKKAGYFSIAYAGAPAVDPKDIDELWQPLIWQDKRFPDRPYLSAASQCSLPATLVTHNGVTAGVIADPAELPFQPLPTFANSRFGVAVRNRDGQAQPSLFAPMLGGPGSKMVAGQPFTFTVRLAVRKGGVVDTYEHLARGLYGFTDVRRNTLTNLNSTLENVIAYGLSEFSRFDDDLRGCAYDTDVAGTVKNVSALHPLEAALVTDDPAIYTRRARPMIEFGLSREGLLFTVDPKVKGQNATWKLDGPCADTSELATLYAMSGRANPALIEYAKQLADTGWTTQLALYHATGERSHLDAAVKGADADLQRRATEGRSTQDKAFFWTSFTAPFTELLELHEATGEKRFLDAAVAGARQFTLFTWMAPAIPDGNITVNHGGDAPQYSYLKKRGLGPIRIAEETVPAWRLSEIGLTPESAGTAGGHRAIFMAHHAPTLLRLAHLSGDKYLHDIARSAVIGRYASFPGYHMNTARTTVYEKPDYPLRAFRELTYNSFHFNHVWPMASFLVDYLVADATARSKGQISFPSRYAEGYGYLKTKIYGDRPGRFFGEEAWLWMPKGLVNTDNVQLNYVSARGDGKLFLSFANQSKESVTANVTVNDIKLPTMRVLQGEAKLDGSRLTVTVPPMGQTSIAIDGVSITPKFTPTTSAGSSMAVAGDMRAVLLSFGGHTSAYIYSRATFETVKEVTLHHGGQAIRDTKYPFEFTVPVQGPTFSFELETTGLDGRAHRVAGVVDSSPTSSGQTRGR